MLSNVSGTDSAPIFRVNFHTLTLLTAREDLFNLVATKASRHIKSQAVFKVSVLKN
jgi:hypothetical protein